MGKGFKVRSVDGRSVLGDTEIHNLGPIELIYSVRQGPDRSTMIIRNGKRIGHPFYVDGVCTKRCPREGDLVEWKMADGFRIIFMHCNLFSPSHFDGTRSTNAPHPPPEPED